MIGDRTGAIHVGKNQIMDLERDEIDVPFSIHVYDGGFLGLAPDTFIHDVDIFLNGSLDHVDRLTIHHGGKLWLNIEGHTEGNDPGFYNFEKVHVQDNGYLHMITNPVDEHGINFHTTIIHIDGGGLIRGTHVYIHSENITVDTLGLLSADGLGYGVEHGHPYHTNGSLIYGLHGVINPGLGTSVINGSASGAGHGGSGGRGTGIL